MNTGTAPTSTPTVNAPLLDTRRFCSRCQMPVKLMQNRNRFDVAHIVEGGEPIWRCPKAPIFADTTSSTSSRRKAMTDAAGNTVRQSKFQLFNMPVTSVLRWMGSRGFTAIEAGAILDFYKLTILPVTLKGHLGDGKHGDGTKGRSGRSIPTLTAEQEADLMKFKIVEQPAATDTKPATKKSKKAAKAAATTTDVPNMPKLNARRKKAAATETKPAEPKAAIPAPKKSTKKAAPKAAKKSTK